jgi:curved DNA-binding protein CbpA
MRALFVFLWALGAVAQLVNHYEVLGVAENAATAEITRAFKLLAIKHHPDKQQQQGSPVAHDFIVQLTEAYSVLKGDQRSGYDEELRFFREHGRLRWQLRYRVYPRTNVWVVIVVTGKTLTPSI